MNTENRRVKQSEERIRFEDFVLQHLPDNRCSSRVVLAWHPGDDFVGTAEAEDSPHGQMKSAAEATAHALEAAAHGGVGLTILSVSALHTLDTVEAALVIVSLSSRVDQRSERLVGSCLIKEHPARGAVLAVLDATNRLLSVYLH
jgi:hypothetical protein